MSGINSYSNYTKPFPLWKWLCILFFLSSCENKIERIKEFSHSDDLPGIQIEDFETLYSDSGVVRFKIISPLLVQFDQNPKEQYSEFPNGITIFRYNSEMEIISKITADYAREFSKEDKWLARNNVVVISEKGDSLKTEELYWDRKNEKFFTDKFVTLISDKNITYGLGMESNQDMSDVVFKNVSGDWQVNVEKE